MFLHTCPIFFSPYINLMPKITYITHENLSHTIEVQNGLTVMEGAVQNDIPGIDANSLNVIYNLADFVNKIAFGVIIWSCAVANSRGR